VGAINCSHFSIKGRGENMLNGWISYIKFFFVLLFLPRSTFTITIDVVIPCHSKDKLIVKEAIKGIRENGKGIRRIIVISKNKWTEEAEWFDENKFPFNKKKIALIFSNMDQNQAYRLMQRYPGRIGWVFQQLLKLYAPFVIPGTSSNILVLDADTIFINKVEFIDDDGKALYAPRVEYNRPYFMHGKRLLPQFSKVFREHSGIAHHMLFQKPILSALFKQIKNKHNVEPWEAFCKTIDIKDFAASEYEIYFNFVFRNYKKKVKLRELKYVNDIRDNSYDIDSLITRGYHMVSSHVFLKN
jgi:hypothetical protein